MTLYVVFDSDWQDPPGTVVKVFRSREAAQAFRDGPGNGYGYSIIEVQEPADE
jgi:hypothetical protein